MKAIATLLLSFFGLLFPPGTPESPRRSIPSDPVPPRYQVNTLTSVVYEEGSVREVVKLKKKREVKGALNGMCLEITHP